MRIPYKWKITFHATFALAIISIAYVFTQPLYFIVRGNNGQEKLSFYWNTIEVTGNDGKVFNLERMSRYDQVFQVGGMYYLTAWIIIAILVILYILQASIRSFPIRVYSATFICIGACALGGFVEAARKFGYSRDESAKYVTKHWDRYAEGWDALEPNMVFQTTPLLGLILFAVCLLFICGFSLLFPLSERRKDPLVENILAEDPSALTNT